MTADQGGGGGGAGGGFTLGSGGGGGGGGGASTGEIGEYALVLEEDVDNEPVVGLEGGFSLL